jgi:hypothetical protein
MATKKITLTELRTIVKQIVKEGKLTEGISNVNPKYTHFAVRKSDNKIVNGWEYKDLDKEDIKDYFKMDMEDQFPDEKLSNFKILTKSGLQKSGINPFDYNNWSN